jgi:hypothetical protein
VAKPLSEHSAALQAMREDIDEILTRGLPNEKGERQPVRTEAIEKLARARVALAELVTQLREAYGVAGLRK